MIYIYILKLQYNKYYVGKTTNPKFRTMVEEVFGPVMTIYVYDAEKWEETLVLVDNTSEYALTGAILSVDRYAAEYATKALENTAGNFYINDKPTGAVVGQQPFGGARGRKKMKLSQIDDKKFVQSLKKIRYLIFK